MGEPATRVGRVLLDDEMIMSKDYEVTGETTPGGGGKTSDERNDDDGHVSQDLEETLPEPTHKNGGYQEVIRELEN